MSILPITLKLGWFAHQIFHLHRAQVEWILNSSFTIRAFAQHFKNKKRTATPTTNDRSIHRSNTLQTSNQCDITFNNRNVSITVSNDQCHKFCFSRSQKLTLTIRRVVVTLNSTENTHSWVIKSARCSLSTTNEWWRIAWNNNNTKETDWLYFIMLNFYILATESN